MPNVNLARTVNYTLLIVATPNYTKFHNLTSFGSNFVYLFKMCTLQDSNTNLELAFQTITLQYWTLNNFNEN